VIKSLITKIIFLISIFFLIFNYGNFSFSKEVVILVKIDNEIITNIDLEKEYRYLLALNQSLQSIDKNKVLNLAKKSIIKEKVKLIEISKYFEIDQQNDYFDQILVDFYKGINMRNETEFKNYLSKHQLNIKDVKTKLKIEALWNELIFTRYKEQIEIDKAKLKKRLKKKLEKNEIQQSYFLYEILFNAENKESLENKYQQILKSIEKSGFQYSANIYSDSETSKNNGKIGWINESQLSELIVKKLKKIKVGEITDVINVPGGSLILKIEDKKKIKNIFDLDKELKKIIIFERNRQLNQFSNIYLKKVKNSLNVYEN